MTDEQGTTTTEKAPPRFEYVIGVDRKDPEPDPEKKRRLVVHLSKPTDEQLLVLLRLVDLAEDDQVGTVRLYGDALDALMDPDNGESHRCQRWLLQGRISAEEFVQVGPAAIRHFFPGVIEAQEQAPKHGPTARPRRPRR